MLITIMLIAAVVALGLPLALRSAPQQDANPLGPKADRHMRWVERHPGEVTTGDIEQVLNRAGLCPADVRTVSEKAVRLGIRPFTMWMFIQSYGERELALAVAADVPHETLLGHLADGDLPDFAELEIFAAFNGLEAAFQRASEDTADAYAHGTGFDGFDCFDGPAPVAAGSSTPHGLGDLDLDEAGDWYDLPDNLSSFEVNSDEPVKDWEFGDGRVA